MAVITISRQTNSLGDEIAKKVAGDLGYDLIGRQQIEQALTGLGLPATEMEKYDEKKPSIWDSLVIQQNTFMYLIRAAIFDFAEQNNAVILGRGAQILLKDLPGTLRVRIVAPMAVRLNRIMADGGYDEKSAERVLRQNDRDSSGFIRVFFNADLNASTHYDLVINTETLSIDTASRMIASAVQSTEFKHLNGDRSSKLADLSLQQKAEAAIMAIQKGNKLFLNVAEVHNGIVTLKGTTDSVATREACTQAISNIRGVRRVINEISVVTPVYC